MKGEKKKKHQKTKLEEEISELKQLKTCDVQSRARKRNRRN